MPLANISTTPTLISATETYVIAMSSRPIGLSTMVSAEAIERGKRVGLHDYVAKFDRPGLIAALKEQTAAMGCAA